VTDDPGTPSSVESAEPSVVYTAYFSAVEELIEHLQAADTLNLGVRVESYLVTAADRETQHREFEFTLLTDMPVRTEDDE
jgi:hypothetical protein